MNSKVVLFLVMVFSSLSILQALFPPVDLQEKMREKGMDEHTFTSGGRHGIARRSDLGGGGRGGGRGGGGGGNRGSRIPAGGGVIPIYGAGAGAGAANNRNNRRRNSATTGNLGRKRFSSLLVYVPLLLFVFSLF